MNSDFMDTLLDGVEFEWKTLDEIALKISKMSYKMNGATAPFFI